MTRQPLFFSTNVLAASPTNDAETVVAILRGVTVQYPGDVFKLHGYVNLDLNADVTACTLLVRRASIAGDPVGDAAVVEGAGITGGGANTFTIDVIDQPGDVANAVYVLTVECDGASGASNVELASLSARCD